MNTIYILIAAFSLQGTISSFAEAPQPLVASYSSLAPTPKWMMETWTGDSKLYQQIQDKVKMAVKASQNPTTLIRQYRASAKQHPTDPTATFRWAFAAYCASFVSPSSKTSGEMTQVRQALAQVTSPRVYEFTRLRFILEASTGGYIYPLKSVGDRLLQQRRKDDVVKFWLIQVLDDGLLDKDKQRALTYAQELIHSAPEKPYGYDLLGWTYLVISLKSHNVSDGDKAIVAYRQSLQRTAADDPSRSNQERHIDLIETMQRSWGSNH